VTSHGSATRLEDGHTWRQLWCSVVATARGERHGGTVRSMVVVLGGQGSDNGEHKDENAKGKSSAWSSRRTKVSERWPVHVGGETTRGRSEIAAISNCGGRGLK
jgi:hypothetical protein